MINKLLDDCFQCELHTAVTDIVAEKSLYWYAFKDTVFFMEKGGMASDIGMINGKNVLGLRIRDGKQWHLMEDKLDVNESVFMSINLHERFRKCQIHTAQHLISALLCNIYKVKTISHHVSDDENDIEFNFDHFTDKMASELMVLCNGLIRDDLEVSIRYPSRSEAALHVSEEQLHHEDELRVVQIGNLDYNLCGCMHVPSLRYLQMVYITGFEKTTRGYKVKYICGDQLLDGVSRRYQVLNEAAQSLAVSHLYLNTGIHRLINENKAGMRDIVLWKQKYFALFATQYAQNDKELLVHEFDDWDVKSMIQLAQYLTSQCQKSCVLLAKIYDKSHVVVAKAKDQTGDCLEVFHDLADRFDLQGGGNASMAQGGGAYSEALAQYVKSIQKI